MRPPDNIAPTPQPEPVASVAEHGCLGALALLRAAGGGTFYVPKGTFLCPPMNLTSNTVVYLAQGATLKADTKADWRFWRGAIGVSR